MSRCKHTDCTISQSDWGFAATCNNCGRRHKFQYVRGPRGGWGRSPKWADNAIAKRPT